MCGIAGISGDWSIAELQEVKQLLSHRGPDDSGVFADSSAGIALVHTRLAILDLSPLGHQPMVSEDGSLVLVFNGEIYNFKELRQELESLGVPFRGHSDTEVLLQAYRVWGEDYSVLLNRLNGIFAFALWDASKRTTLLARDAFGVKPLYYSTSTRSCCFSSEIKALRPWLPSEAPLDPVAVGQYLTWLWTPGQRTPTSVVQKLEPGHYATVRDGHLDKPIRWYRLPMFRGLGLVKQPRSPEKVASLLRQAVQRQLIADVPVGAFLSGGLDSSSVVAFAREKTPDIRCFTIRVSGSADPGFVDDLPYAQLAANHLGVSLDVVDVAAGDMARDVSWMVNQLDEPLADPAALNVFYISKAARVAGIKVLLSGAGGDDLFTGYRRHLAERWLSRTRIIPERGWRVAAALFGRMDQRRALWRRAAKLANSASQSADDRLIDYFRWIRPEMLESLMEPAVRLEVTRDDIAAPMRTWLNDLSGDIMPLDRLLSLEQRFFLPDHNLTYTDKMSMAAGVETRVPFLDLDLVAYAATFSAEDKMHRSQLKGILKSAMKPWLPNEIIYRPKAGFGGPVRRWVLNELRELINDTLSEDSLRKRGIFKPAAVSELILANSKGQVDASYTIFSLLCVELWCRQYRAAAAA